MLYKPKNQDLIDDNKKINQVTHILKRLTPPILFDFLSQIKQKIYAKI
jgi:hypothetical protein